MGQREQQHRAIGPQAGTTPLSADTAKMPPMHINWPYKADLSLSQLLGAVYLNYSSFSDNYLLSRVIPKVPAGTQVGVCMYNMCLLLPTQACLLVANRHPQD